MTEKFNKQLFYNRCCTGDYKQVMAYLNQVTGGKRIAAKLKAIFEGDSYVLKSKNPEVLALLRVYEDYYKWAIGNVATTEQCMEHLFDKLSHLFPNAVKYDGDFEHMIKEYLEKRGYFALVGTTAPYPDLYLWKHQTIRKKAVEIPYGTVSVDACAMRGVISKGWLEYLSLGKIGTAGWATSTGINYFAFDYPPFSPRFNSLLKHEAQHLHDLRHYPDIEQADMEYRAKLVELIYYKNPMPFLSIKILGMLGSEDGNDRSTNPHGYANRRIAQELSRRLFHKDLEVNRELWKGQKNKISVIAKKLLDESTAGLVERAKSYS